MIKYIFFFVISFSSFLESKEKPHLNNLDRAIEMTMKDLQDSGFLRKNLPF